MGIDMVLSIMRFTWIRKWIQCGAEAVRSASPTPPSGTGFGGRLGHRLYTLEHGSWLLCQETFGDKTVSNGF